jgi:hypothetical protein
MYSSFPVWRLLTQILALALWTILTFFVAAQLFRWEPESKIPRSAKLWVLATALPFFLLGVWENKNGQILTQAQAAYRSLDRRPSSTEQPKPDSPSMGTLPKSKRDSQPQQ